METKQLTEQKHSGFTLIEMVVVVGIIAILLGVMAPTMRSYYINSRLNSANSQAKVLFNSAQTLMQEYEFSERSLSESYFYGSDDASTSTLFIKRVYNGGTPVISGVDGNITVTSSSASFAGTDYNNLDVAGSFCSRLSRLFADYGESAWAIRVDGYTVHGVVCAATDHTDYIGGFPLRGSDPGDLLGNGVTITSMTAADMNSYCASAW